MCHVICLCWGHDKDTTVVIGEFEHAQIELTEAQKRQTEINTVLNIADKLDNDTVLELICEQLDIDVNEIKDKLPEEEQALEPYAALNMIDNAPTEPDVMTDE